MTVRWGPIAACAALVLLIALSLVYDFTLTLLSKPLSQSVDKVMISLSTALVVMCSHAVMTRTGTRIDDEKQ